MIELPTITHHNISTVLYTSIRITRDSKLQCAQSHITILQCPISGLFLPRVMPLGHLMLSVTKATRSAPFSPLFSILASSPQSVQYMKLETDTVPSVKTPTSNTLQHNIWRSLEKITHTHTDTLSFCHVSCCERDPHSFNYSNMFDNKRILSKIYLFGFPGSQRPIEHDTDKQISRL